jgi:hypothetical protein
MDLSKAKFEILTTKDIPTLQTDTIEFINYNPDKEHLSDLGSGQYTLEEGAVFLADEEDDLEEYEEILNSIDHNDPDQVLKAYDKLESKGYVKVGDAIVCNFLKRGTKETEYALALNIDFENMIIIAVSTNKKLISQYKKLIDNQVTRFKIGLILDSHPERIISREDYFNGIREEIEIEESELGKLNL